MTAQIIEKAGRKEFAVIPYKQFLKMQEALGSGLKGSVCDSRCSNRKRSRALLFVNGVPT